MENVFAFLHAALPWITIGLLLAVFFARSATKKENREDYGTEGMCVGMCFGSAIGAAGVVNIGLGITLGMLLGLLIGSSKEKKPKE